MDTRPYVNKKDAKKLKALGKIEGKDFVVPKHCAGQRGHLCIICYRLIRRYDQRCRP
jgi:hypothetical protein